MPVVPPSRATAAAMASVSSRNSTLTPLAVGSTAVHHLSFDDNIDDDSDDGNDGVLEAESASNAMDMVEALPHVVVTRTGIFASRVAL
jgi:hypothetical protein